MFIPSEGEFGRNPCNRAGEVTDNLVEQLDNWGQLTKWNISHAREKSAWWL
jgi:hypothetical protein